MHSWYDGCDFGVQPDGYVQLTGDIRDVGPHDLEGFDAIVHLPAISNDPIGHLNPGGDVSYQRLRRRTSESRNP